MAYLNTLIRYKTAGSEVQHGTDRKIASRIRNVYCPSECHAHRYASRQREPNSH